MKLWLIAQDANSGYDTYDSAVVVAETAEEARSIHPSGNQRQWDNNYPSWAERPDQVSAVEIGTPLEGFANSGRVILASFNAG